MRAITILLVVFVAAVVIVVASAHQGKVGTCHAPGVSGHGTPTCRPRFR